MDNDLKDLLERIFTFIKWYIIIASIISLVLFVF